MKHLLSINTSKKNLLYCVISLLFTVSDLTAFFTSRTCYVPRSQGTNIVRDDVGWQTFINQSSTDTFYGAIAITPSYARSFRPQEFVNFLLQCPTVNVTGSSFPNRGPQDILADYWGLAPDYESVLCFDPKINNFILDFNFYFGLDYLLNGLYLRINAPVTQTSWDLSMQEFIKEQGVDFFPAGYMSELSLSGTAVVQNAAAFLKGTATFGDMAEPLAYGKIFQRQVESRIAELRVAMGWNWTGDRHHLGVDFCFAVPTGTRPEGEFLFEPIAGNGKHWEVGGGLTAHYTFWSNEEETNDIGIYFDARVVHLCNARQKRSFDFRQNGFGSRYMLIEEMTKPSQDLFLGSDTGPASPYQYRGFLAPAINYTTLNIRTSFGVQADTALTFLFRRQGLTFELGYDFFGRSGEQLQWRDAFPSNMFAMKGDAQLYGFDDTTSAPIALAATQSGATLHAGQGGGNANFTNQNADAPINAADSNGLLLQLTAADSATLGIPQATVNTSNPPVLLSDCDLNINGALLGSAISNALFFHISHVWQEKDDWSPFIGFGGETEWACGNTPSTYSQWGIWAKGGVGF